MKSWAQVMTKGMNIYGKEGTQTIVHTYNLKTYAGLWGDWHPGGNKSRKSSLGEL